jgi:RNA polymerase sigma-70 factor (ECF subfamily)
VSDSRSVEDDFRDFVAARSSALLRTAYLLAGDWATAEDLLQISLTKTFLAWKRLGRIEAVEPYTRRVLVNTATSWWRRRWHGERPTEVLPERATADGLEERLERDALWRHVRTLPARQRAVLVLRFYEDMSEAETARLLDVSVGTVKSQCSRALATLRQRLGEQGIEPAQRQPKASTKASKRGPAPKETAKPADPGTGPALTETDPPEHDDDLVDADELAELELIDEVDTVEERAPRGELGEEVATVALPIVGVMAAAELGQGS